MCLNVVIRIQEDLLPSYQIIKLNSEFAEYFIPDRYHPSYYRNVQIYTSLGHSLLVAIANYTCVKPFTVTQAYKVVSTHTHEMTGWTILYRILHSLAPHIGGINGDAQSELSIVAFKNGEQLEYFHIIILTLQQEIFLSVETVSPTRLLFQYIKTFSESNKIKASIVPKMTDLITLLDNNVKSAFYTEGNIHGLYCYLEIIGAPTTLTTSGQRSHNFGSSYSNNNYSAYLQPVIAALRMSIYGDYLFSVTLEIW